MAFNDLELARIRIPLSKWLARRRPPPQVRAELDLAYRISGQSIEIVEVRPAWGGQPGEVMERGLAKATYVISLDAWRIYWQRADLKWHRYEPFPTAISVEQFLAVVDEDQFACFFG